MRWLHGIALVLGASLFGALLLRVEPQWMWDKAATLGWGLVLIVAIEGFADFLHTLAWQRCFAPAHRPRVLALWWVHLAGAAINFVTPTATLGGDVVRGTLVPATVPIAEATASLALNKLTATLDDVVLLVGGAGVLLLVGVSLPADVRTAILLAVGFIGAVGFCLLVLQRRGRLAGLLGDHPALAHLVGAERAARVARAAADVDARIAAFHANRPGELVSSVALHVVGNAIGALQLFVFLRWTGYPSDVGTVALVFLVARMLDVAAFFIPARLGAQEGARMAATSLAGLGAPIGLLLSLALRVEQLVWTALGLGAYAVLVASRPRGAPAVSSSAPGAR